MYIKLTRSRYFKLYHLRLMGANHKIVMSSEQYFKKSNAVQTGRRMASELGIEFKER